MEWRRVIEPDLAFLRHPRLACHQQLGHQTDLFHHERLSLLGELLNTLRHELSNPLFGLQLSSQILKEDLAEDTENLEFIEEISKNINRSQEIIKNFSELFLEKNLTKNIGSHSS